MGREPVPDDVIVAQIAEARARGRRAHAHEPHAAVASYDRRTHRIVVGLTNGASFAVPVASIPELRRADAVALAQVEVGPVGVALHWPVLDVDLSVVGLARLALGATVVGRPGAGDEEMHSAKARARRRTG